MEGQAESRFYWVGGHLCLDFVNTEKMQAGERVDLLSTGQDFEQWVREAKLIPDGKGNPDSVSEAQWEMLLPEARGLRQVFRDMAAAIEKTGTPEPGQVDTINRYLARYPGSLQLERTNAGEYREQFVPQTVEPQRVLLYLARAGTDLLCHHDLARVRRCESPNCILYFLDTTKNRGRRWCSMEGCGNRAKAAAFYQRHKASRRETVRGE
ncbi:MAG: ABATE domain-containing protein [Armatimonadaceae bacterium]